MPNAMINGVDLYYECHGAGDPLMLIAGLASDSQSWLPIVEELSRHYQVILPDNRGVGRTKPQDAVTGIRQIADDCMALMDYLGLPSVNLLGHSMGGFVALDWAIRVPERIDKLILAATAAFNSERNNTLFHDWASDLASGDNPERWFINLFHWIFSKHFFKNPKAVNEAVQYAIDYPYPQSALAFTNQVEAIREFDCREKLTNIKSQTLIVCGKEDLLFPPEESIAELQSIPQTTISIVEHAAHSIHMENPEAFIDCVLRFLRKS